MKAFKIFVYTLSLLCSLNAFAGKHNRDENVENIEPETKRIKIHDPQNALFISIELKFAETVKHLLLEGGVNPNTLNSQLQSPLQVAFEAFLTCNDIKSFHAKQSMKIIGHLLKFGADITSLDIASILFLLQQSIVIGEHEIVQHILTNAHIPTHLLREHISLAIKNLLQSMRENPKRSQRNAYFVYFDILSDLLRRDPFARVSNLSVEDANMILDTILDIERQERQEFSWIENDDFFLPLMKVLILNGATFLSSAENLNIKKLIRLYEFLSLCSESTREFILLNLSLRDLREIIEQARIDNVNGSFLTQLELLLHQARELQPEEEESDKGKEEDTEVTESDDTEDEIEAINLFLNFSNSSQSGESESSTSFSSSIRTNYHSFGLSE